MSGAAAILVLVILAQSGGPPPVPADDPYLSLPAPKASPPAPSAPPPAPPPRRLRWWEPGFGAQRATRRSGAYPGDAHSCPDDCPAGCPCDRTPGLRAHVCGAGCDLLGDCTCRRRPARPSSQMFNQYIYHSMVR